mmetsp:Transcript_7720/g.18857  ORF Transcript_7720/g.18857 Transcript_7720/m.18857 type:complete len:100 (-) Transcript_7720:4935-5234(-)
MRTYLAVSNHSEPNQFWPNYARSHYPGTHIMRSDDAEPDDEPNDARPNVSKPYDMWPVVPIALDVWSNNSAAHISVAELDVSDLLQSDEYLSFVNCANH